MSNLPLFNPISSEAPLNQILKKDLLDSPWLGPMLRQADAEGKAPAILRRHALPLLRGYQAYLQQLQSANARTCCPGWDNLLLPLLIESENAMTPGMNCRLRTAVEFANCIKQAWNEATTSDSVFVIDHAGHRAAAQLSAEASRPPRFAILDNWHYPSAALKNILSHMDGDGVTGVGVDLNTMIGRVSDCSIQALATAKNIAADQPAIDVIYGLDPIAQSPRASLPLKFFKHVVTRFQLDDLVASRPDAKGSAVNKKQPAVDIAARWEAHQVVRADAIGQCADHSVIPYSASSEVKRRFFISRAILHFEAVPSRP